MTRWNLPEDKDNFPNQQVKRVLVEFEDKGKSFELEIKDIKDSNGRFDLRVIDTTPDLPLFMAEVETTSHIAMLDIHVLTRSEEQKDGVIYTIREVRGT